MSAIICVCRGDDRALHIFFSNGRPRCQINGRPRCQIIIGRPRCQIIIRSRPKYDRTPPEFSSTDGDYPAKGGTSIDQPGRFVTERTDRVDLGAEPANSGGVIMATIKARDIDLATVERLKRRVGCAERSGDRAGSLHVPSEPTDSAGASNHTLSSNPREDPADELVIQLDAESLRAFLNLMEARILADRSSPIDAEGDPRERARRIREGLAGRTHGDSGAIQHEDRRR